MLVEYLGLLFRLVFYGYFLSLGVFLPKLCDEQAFRARRGMAAIRSSGIAAAAAGPISVAAGPMSGSDEKLACAPVQSETEEDVAFAPAVPPSFEN